MTTLVAVDDASLFGMLAKTVVENDDDDDGGVVIVDSTALGGVRTCRGARRTFTNMRFFVALDSVPCEKDWRRSNSKPLLWREAVYIFAPFEMRRVVAPLALCRVVEPLERCEARVRWMTRRADSVVSSYDLVIAPHDVNDFYVRAACAPTCLNVEWEDATQAQAPAVAEAN